MIQQVIERSFGDGDRERVHGREVGGRQITSVMELAEHDGASWTGRGTPVANAAFEGAAVTIAEPSRKLSSHPVEQRLGLEPRLEIQTSLDNRPNINERVRPSTISTRGFPWPGRGTVRSIFAGRFFIHVRPPCRLGQRHSRSELAEEEPQLSVRDHRKPPNGRGLR